MHNIRSFLGLTSYYRKFIRGFSQIAKPLTDLTRDKVAWRWGDTENNSFLALKVAMAMAPILHLPDFERQFLVTTDAIDVDIRTRFRVRPTADRIFKPETKCDQNTLFSI